MATEKPSYTPTQWKNENEGGDVPDINAENLNHIEQGLKDIYDYAIQSGSLAQQIPQLNSKFPEDKSYISAVIPRVIDITSGADQPALRLDIEYMIQTKGIKSGEYGFSGVQYTDLPASASEWGYVKYFQHADNFVTVMVFPDGLTGGILLNQFIIGQNKWSTTWKKIDLLDVS